MMFTSQEKKILKQLLSYAGDKSKVLNVEGVHGFFFGLAIIPEMVMPSEWLPGIFGEEMLDFSDEDKVHRLMEGLFKIYNRVMGDGADGKLTFPFDLASLATYEIQDIRDWTRGFFLAISLRQKLWGLGDPEAVKDNEDEIVASLSVVMGVAFPERIPELFEAKPGHQRAVDLRDPQLEAKLFVLLPRAVATLQDHTANAVKAMGQGSSRRGAAPSQPRRAEKVGRNDPCPCGSGSKYKKCCGK